LARFEHDLPMRSRCARRPASASSRVHSGSPSTQRSARHCASVSTAIAHHGSSLSAHGMIVRARVTDAPSSPHTMGWAVASRPPRRQLANATTPDQIERAEQHDRAEQRNEDAPDADHPRVDRSTAEQLLTQERAEDPDHDVRQDALPGIRLHDPARQLADGSAGNQSEDDAHGCRPAIEYHSDVRSAASAGAGIAAEAPTAASTIGTYSDTRRTGCGGPHTTASRSLFARWAGKSARFGADRRF
jgi:hypothetical protein